MIEVRVPSLGEKVTEATISTWFKRPGEYVGENEMLCELETDKVSVEVPSPAAGKIFSIVAAEGETVSVDALLSTIDPTKRHDENSDTANVFEALPEAPEQAFAKIYQELIPKLSQREGFVSEFQREALIRIDVAAEELELDWARLKSVDLTEPDLIWSESLVRRLDFAKSRIFRNAQAEKISSIRQSFKSARGTKVSHLSNQTIIEISSLLSSLEKTIVEHPFEKKRKNYILKRIDSLKQDILQDQVNGAKFLAVLGGIGAVMIATTSFLADSPQALETVGKVVALIGYETSDEDEVKMITGEDERLQLPPPSP